MAQIRRKFARKPISIIQFLCAYFAQRLPFFLQNIEQSVARVIRYNFRYALLQRMSLRERNRVSIFVDGIANLLQTASVVGRSVIIQDRRVRDQNVQTTVPQSFHTFGDIRQRKSGHVGPQLRIRSLHIVFGRGRSWRTDSLRQQL